MTKVWTTRTTVLQLSDYFSAWNKYVSEQQAELPYEKEYVYKIRYRYIEEHAAAGEWLEIKPGIRVCWGRSGHLLGSVWLMLEADGRRIFFSGDYTSESVLLAADTPSWPVSAEAAKAQFKDSWMDMVIADAAYGTDSEDNRPS